jgi:hypothetical protein
VVIILCLRANSPFTSYLTYIYRTVVLIMTGSLYNCYVYFLVSVLRAAEELENCYIVFCKLLSFSEYEDWMHIMVFFYLVYQSRKVASLFS